MLLFVREMIHRLNDNDLLYFQSAYYWKHQKHVSVIGDLIAFRTQGIVPSYVQEYTMWLERESQNV